MIRNTVFVFIVVSLLGKEAEAQRPDTNSDLKMINEYLIGNSQHPVKRSYLYKNDTLLLRKLNPLNALAGGMLYIYQNVFTKQISSSCIYNPSCSEFSKKAIFQYGLMKGSLLSADRIWRCNSFTASELSHKHTDQAGAFPDPPGKYMIQKHQSGK